MQEDRIMVSVIMPAYNAAKTCGKTIESVLKQTYNDFELIIINDGSKDETESICEKYAKTDSRLKFFSQANQGVSAARNNGLNRAIGKYITFIDSDDEYTDSFLKEMVEAIERDNSEIAICGFADLETNNVMYIPKQCNDIQQACLHLLQKVKGTSGLNPPWNKLYLKECIINKFNTSKQMGEDLEFVCSYLSNSKSVSMIEKPLYLYKNSSIGSLTTNVELKLNAILPDMMVIMDLIKKLELDSQIVYNKLYERTEGIISSATDYKLFKEYCMHLINDNEYRKTIARWIPNKRKNKFIRKCMINKQLFGLYSYINVKKKLKKLLKNM